MRYPGVEASGHSLLIVDDNPSDTALLRADLQHGRFADARTDEATTLAQALQLLARRHYDAVLIDLGLPDSDGLDTFAAVHEAAGDAAVVVLSGPDDEPVAEEAVRRGAQDYLVKGDRRGDPARAIRLSVHRQQLCTEVRVGRDSRLAEKDRFLSHISQELRSPIEVVQQFGALLADGIAGPLNEEQIDLLNVLMHNVAQLRLMIEDLLRVSYARTSEVAIEPQVVAPAALLAEPLVAFRAAAQERDIQLAYEPRAVPDVVADPRRVREILDNLIENALKFTPPGGSVTVSAEPDGDFVRFAVRDNGCGIDPVALPHIFEQFFQAEQVDGAHHSGLGLGLFVSRDLVTRHGGVIRAESQLGQGTTVWFTLPCDRERLPAQLPAR